MNITTKTIVRLDGVELREIVAAHLRESGVLTEEDKFTISFEGADEISHNLKRPDDLRMAISWCPARERKPIHD